MSTELLRTIRPVTAPDAKRKAIARDLLADLRRHDHALKALDLELRDAVVASGSTLTEIHGLGVVTAAKILALTGDVRRFPSQDHFASYAGTVVGRESRDGHPDFREGHASAEPHRGGC